MAALATRFSDASTLIQQLFDDCTHRARAVFNAARDTENPASTADREPVEPPGSDQASTAKEEQPDKA